MSDALSSVGVNHDPHSFAQPERVRIKALALALEVSFERRQLIGTATLALDWHDARSRELVLDTRDLDIERVEQGDGTNWQPVEFTLDPADAILGSALRITLPQRAPVVRIVYRTRPEAFGLQWLDAAQTGGKRQPFMFSQSQAINARSWIPLQDTPAVRFTYRAKIQAPQALRATMSADNDPAHALDGVYEFSMPQPIPSYLLALAVGDLAVSEIGPRSAVYAEPDTLGLAATEFADTESMIKTTEALYGPYRWDRYDLLVLPPSFPFGGMENPRLTFATPTILVGDRSLMSLVAHELAHSWSGNLVTNAAWKHIWLNEGFTTYVQGRIVEAVYGKAQADEEFIIAVGGLRETFKRMPPEDQWLVPDLDGRDPDEGLSLVPYIKGSWMLQWLEAQFGRERFDHFLRGYFDHFAFRSITTGDFLAYAQTHLLEAHPGCVTREQIDQWLYQPGIPDFAELPRSARFIEKDKLRGQFLSGHLDATELQASKWTTQEWQYFLDGLPSALSLAQMRALDAACHLTGSKNAEIAFRWYRLAIASGYKAAFDAMREHMLRIGRRILVVPLYEALAKTDAGLALASDIFAQAKPGYHPMTRAAVEKVLNVTAAN